MRDLQGLILPEIVIFDWDEGNLEKNKKKHDVNLNECEQVFHFNAVYYYDEKHSQKEDRYVVYGETDKGRKLAIIFTLRNKKIRVISARDQNKYERREYEKNQTNTKI